MPRRSTRRVGRSDEERRQALKELQRQWEAGPRAHLTTEQLRRARELMEQRFAMAEDRRRAEDMIRDEYHDSRAIIVTWTRKPRRLRKGR